MSKRNAFIQRFSNASMVSKLTLVSSFGTMIAVGVSVWLVYNTSKQLLFDHEVRAMKHSMNRCVERASQRIEEVKKDTILLSKSSSLQGVLRARNAGGLDPQTGLTENDFLDRLTQEFLAISDSKGYQQVRYIEFENNGKEIIRVDRVHAHEGHFGLVPQEYLQHKGDSKYVIKGKYLNFGEVYVSDIHLNQENGVIEYPHRPTQRFVTPVAKLDVGDHFQRNEMLQRSKEIYNLSQLIENYDLQLTNAAIQAAKTGDTRWKLTYDKIATDLDVSLKHALEISGENGKEAIKVIDKANTVLIELEQQSFEFIKREQFTSAMDLLDSPEYIHNKEQYQIGLQKLIDSLESMAVQSQGVIVINYDAKELLNADIKDLSPFEIIVENSNGGVLLHPDKEMEWDFEYSSYHQIKHNISNRSATWDANNEEFRVVDSVMLSSQDNRELVLTMYVRDDIILAEVNALKNRIITLSLIAVLVTSICSFIVLRFLVKPVVILTNQIRKRMQDGNTEPFAVIGSGEINTLSQAFIELVSEIEEQRQQAQRNSHSALELAETLDKRVNERTEALVESQAKTAAILDSVVDGIITLDEQDCIQVFNTSAERIFGYHAEDIIGYPVTTLLPYPILEGSEPGLINHLKTNLNELLKESIESNGFRNNGEEFPIELSFNVLQSVDGITFTVVCRDITARKLADQELRDAKELAEASTKSKSEFLANMSHEIRTPMTAILGYADILKELENTSGSSTDKESAINTIQRNGDHLLQIINDILDISKIEANKLEMEHVECKPIQLVRDVIDLMKVRAAPKGIDLSINIDNEIPTQIMSDPTRLKQILVNIVGNAIKFTDSGSVTIDIKLNSIDNKPVLEFSVIDTGIGLSEDQVQKLFQAFSQADASTTRKYGGTGLGLMLSRRMANLLGGSITVQSKQNVGSTFTITVETGSLEGVPMDIGDKQDSESDLLPIESPQIPTIHNCNILLAEDGADNQRLITYILKKAGAQVTIASTGRQALERAIDSKNKGIPYDIILMDMLMPEMDGYQAATKLRQEGYIAPIIALTANAMDGDMDKCIKAGCDAYETKPINRTSLITTIASFYNSSSKAA